MKTIRFLSAMLCMYVLCLAQGAVAIPNYIEQIATNPYTGAQVILQLTKYNLRTTNWHVRLYTTPSNYTLLTQAQIPEVTTFRGTVSNSPGAHVVAGIKPGGAMFARVTYGSQYHSTDGSLGGNAYDPYDGTVRYSWTRDQWGNPSIGVLAAHRPTSGTYSYAWTSNMPVVVAAPMKPWYNNLGATNNFGGAC